MKIKYYAKQINPEFASDDLFYTYKDKKTGRYVLGMNDDYYYDNVIIYGNKDYCGITTKEFDCIMKIGDVYYEYEPLTYKGSNHCYWNNVTEFINWYFPKKEGKYTARQIHKWKELLERYSEHWREEDIIIDALHLMTGKTWREIKLTGYCQSDWQYGYVSDEVGEQSVRYIEMCYFNLGSEFIVYENRKDFKNNDNGYSIYVDSYDSKTELADRLGCSTKEISMYEWDGYKQIPQYKHC